MDVNKQFNFHWNCSALIGFYCIAGCSISALRLKDISIKTNQSFSSGSNVHEMGTSQINWTHPLWYQNVYLKYNLLNYFLYKWFFEINYNSLSTIAKKQIVSYLLRVLGSGWNFPSYGAFKLIFELIECLVTLVRPDIKVKN